LSLALLLVLLVVKVIGWWLDRSHAETSLTTKLAAWRPGRQVIKKQPPARNSL
jgi:hypothetical protein